jgi:uncharacterized phiE125 gp8 family phage protein
LFLAEYPALFIFDDPWHGQRRVLRQRRFRQSPRAARCGIDNGRRVRLIIAGLFDGEAGESQGVLAFIPNRKPKRARFARDGELDGAPVRLTFIGEDGVRQLSLRASGSRGMTIDYETIAEILPIEDIKLQLRVETADEDVLIESFAVVAVEAIESETGHLFTPRTAIEHFASFEAVRLRAFPIVSIESIDYFDRDGAAQTFDPALVRLTASRRPARLVQLTTPWPCTGGIVDSLSVTMNAGYAAAADVPHRLRQAALMMISDLYAQRESFASGVVSSVPMSLTVDRLLQPFRIVDV